MLCISALNESSHDQCEKRKYPSDFGSTKEAQESEAIALYNEALRHRQLGSLRLARQAFLRLLDLPFVEKSIGNVLQEEGIDCSSALLRYSALKNLAELAESDNETLSEVALDYYIMAVEIDSTDVSVWFKIGKLSLANSNFSLARHAFEMGLELNPLHWPCLDNVITLFYVLNNCEACLQHIAIALERDPYYAKGIVLRERIFDEYPYLQSWAVELFQKCELKLCAADFDEEESHKFVEEVLKLKHRKRELVAAQPSCPQRFTASLPLASLNWKCLGTSLLSIYNSINSKQNLSENNDSSPTFYTPVWYDVNTSTGSDVVNCAPDEEMAEEPPLTVKEMDSTAPLQAVLSMETDLLESFSKNLTPKRGRKRKNLIADDLQNSSFVDSSKRRSTRMRGCVSSVKTKEETSINYRDFLEPFLPASLVSDVVDSGCETVAPASVPVGAVKTGNTNHKNNADSTSVFQCFTDEAGDVEAFLQKHQTNSGIINLLTAYLVQLSSNDHTCWPEGLCDVYLSVYKKLRKHIVYPNYFSKDESPARMQALARVCLVELELVFDKWRNMIGTATCMMSPNSPRRNPAHGSVSIDGLHRHFVDDLSYVAGICCIDDVFSEDFFKEFGVRASWLHARYSAAQNDVGLGVFFFNQTLDWLESMESDDRCIVLPNCLLDNRITSASINQLLDSIRKYQSLDEVYRLSETGDHNHVVSLLLPFFSDLNIVDVMQVDRSEQLLILMDSLIVKNDLQIAFSYGESFLNELHKRYPSASTLAKEHSETVVKLVRKLCRCINSEDNVVLSHMSAYVQKRLAYNLIELIALVMDQGSSTELLCASLWILLFKLIQCAEKSSQKEIGGQKEEDANDENILSQSLKLLILAHEHLGRRGWCMMEQGSLLLFAIDVLSQELSKWNLDEPHPCKDDIDSALAQCFYCLYGHPNKRARAKLLDDHNVTAIPLVWENCQTVFDFFKPKTLPEYDSYKTSAVSAELESLLRRILVVIPPFHQEGSRLEALTLFIEGTTSIPPVATDLQLSPLVKELYYLLADFYFKNKEMAKATKFYMLDLCINPERFDSWAGMALARASRIETKLSAHELKMDVPLQKPGICTLRCFKRALELDGSNVKLWIEYGSQAYLQHSHASRLLKQDQLFAPALPRDLIEHATSNYTEMLMLAENCFKMAVIAGTSSDMESEITSEKWLLHYMLGKIAEKLKESPEVYLTHYQEAAHCLHEDKAKYPKKINYYNASYLAVESLEIFYRLHVSIVKYLLRHESNKCSIPFDVIQQYVEQCSNGPFVTCFEKEKKVEKKSEMLDCDENSIPVSSGVGISRYTRSKGLRDHNYSKPKNPDAGFGSSFAELQEDIDNVEHSVSVSVGGEQQTCDNSLKTSFSITNLPSADIGLISNSSLNFHLDNVSIERAEQTSLDEQEVLSAAESSVEIERKKQVESSNQKSCQEAVTPKSQREPVDSNQSAAAASDSSDLSFKQQETLERVVNSSTSDGVNVCLDNAFDEDAGLVNQIGPSVSSSQNRPQVGVNEIQDAMETEANVGVEQAMCSDEEVSFKSIKTPDSTFISCDLNGTQSQEINADSPVVSLLTDERKGESAEVPHSQFSSVPPEVNETPSEEKEKCSQIPHDYHLSPLPHPRNFETLPSEQQKSDKLSSSQSVTSEIQTSQLPKDCEAMVVEQSVSILSTRLTEPHRDELAKIRTPDDKDVDGHSIGVQQEANNEATKIKVDIQFQQLLSQCIKALELCLSRFPQHYKSAYRLAHVYFRSTQFKDETLSRNLLLGNQQQANANLPCAGLFQERKQTNFFQGLWRIPSAEVDRAGSFASHLSRTLLLLLAVLKANGDSKALITIHKQLAPMPDVGKKYLRDGDRVMLSEMAFKYCVDCLEQDISQMVSLNSERKFEILMQTSVVCQHAMKTQHLFEKISQLLSNAYKVYTGNKSVLRIEDIIQHCSRIQSYQFAQEKFHSTSSAPTASYQNQSNTTKLPPSTMSDSQRTPLSPFLRLSMSSEKQCDFENELEFLSSRKIDSRPTEGSYIASYSKWVSTMVQDAAVADRSNVTVKSPVSWSEKNRASGAVAEPNSSCPRTVIAWQIDAAMASLAAAAADSDSGPQEEISDGDEYEVIVVSSSED